MAVLYICGSLVVLLMNAQHLGEAFGLIFTCAFNPSAGLGGAFFGIWAAITQGAKRGLFSNEAGMGSTPHAHALANVKDPHDQGVVAMIGVFIDTFVVLTLNALVIISTLYTPDGILAAGYTGNEVNAAGEAIAKANLAQTAFGSVFGTNFGNIFVAICLLFFAFSTVLSWNMFGRINAIYLFGHRSVIVYQIISLVFIFLGTLASNDLVWELSDLFNQLMVLPNSIALFALTGMVLHGARKKSV
jgi:AGCS family alanine or glycine:cation symporter